MNPTSQQTNESKREMIQYHDLSGRVKVQLWAFLLYGVCLSTFGGAALFFNETVGNAWFILGLLSHVMGLMLILAVAIAVYCLATKIEFTFDSIHIHQLGRTSVKLPYNEYSFQWIADVRETGNIRLLMIDHHRGCTVLNPPSWVRENFNEIARIQREEGWYAPDAVETTPEENKKITTKAT
ncbi:MAG: hypothetical protein ACFCU1_09040 [Sumerlaeia bacterium]